MQAYSQTALQNQSMLHRWPPRLLVNKFNRSTTSWPEGGRTLTRRQVRKTRAIKIALSLEKTPEWLVLIAALLAARITITDPCDMSSRLSQPTTVTLLSICHCYVTHAASRNRPAHSTENCWLSAVSCQLKAAGDGAELFSAVPREWDDVRYE